MFYFDKIDRLNETLFIRKASALDAFQLFYEELTSSKAVTAQVQRIRRVRAAGTAK